MSIVKSFAEESCWDGERFRSVRRPVIFVLAAEIPRHGMIRHEFESDFGVFYDVEDDWLADQLKRDLPHIDWGWFVFHKKLDHSAIQIINPDSGRVVGQIYHRGTKQSKRPSPLPEGVVSMDEWRRKLSAKSVESDSTAGS